jgi:prostaglandin-E synthase 1
MTSFTSPAFVAYAITSVILCLNLLVLWAFSGGVRTRTKTAVNSEDAALFKAQEVQFDPPPVARVLRAHANAQATIYPFLILGLVYVLIGGAYNVAVVIFAVFVLARLAHSVFYLAARQPWRTTAFTVSGVALLALIVALIWRLATLGH